MLPNTKLILSAVVVMQPRSPALPGTGERVFAAVRVALDRVRVLSAGLDALLVLRPAGFNTDVFFFLCLGGRPPEGHPESDKQSPNSQLQFHHLLRFER